MSCRLCSVACLAASVINCLSAAFSRPQAMRDATKGEHCHWCEDSEMNLFTSYSLEDWMLASGFSCPSTTPCCSAT